MDSSKNDFKTLKRKDLQRLCKKYGLRANSTNSQMTDSLASYFKNCEKNIQEEVEGDAEKVLIILDEEEDERELNLKSCAGVSGDMEGTKVQWHEENSIIILDEEDHKPVPVHTDELLHSEVDLTSSQILGSGASPNLASSSPKLLLSEWKGGQGKSENPLRFPDSQHQAEIKSGQIVPFEFNKRFDIVLEKLLCLTKVLRGEIPLAADSSLPCEQEISHKDCERNRTNPETLDGQYPIQNEQEFAKNPVAVYEVESRDISMPRTDTFPVANPSEHKDSSLPCEQEISHEDCERNSTNSETLDGQYPIQNEQECAKNPVAVYEVESRDISMTRTDTFPVANPSEHKASVSKNDVDPIEEISRKLVKFCISSSQKPSKSDIINTPRIKSPGTFKHHSSMGNLRDKENTKHTEPKNSSSKQKMRNSASAGSIRRPLRSVTNQMID